MQHIEGRSFATNIVQKMNKMQFNQGKRQNNHQTYQRTRESQPTVQKKVNSNMGVINFNNYNNGETEVNMPLKTEGNRIDPNRAALTTLAQDQRNQKVKSAMIVLSGQKNQINH